MIYLELWQALLIAISRGSLSLSARCRELPKTSSRYLPLYLPSLLFGSIGGGFYAAATLLGAATQLAVFLCAFVAFLVCAPLALSAEAGSSAFRTVKGSANTTIKEVRRRVAFLRADGVGEPEGGEQDRNQQQSATGQNSV